MESLLDIQFISFELANEKYALKISDIYEIIRMQQINPVHNSKPFLEGVINLRGKIIPVVNLYKKLGLGNYTNTKFTRIIVVQCRDEMIGIIVDRVSKVIKFQDVQTPTEFMGAIEGEYFEGLGITDEGVIGLLKIDMVLNG